MLSYSFKTMFTELKLIVLTTFKKNHVKTYNDNEKVLKFK